MECECDAQINNKQLATIINWRANTMALVKGVNKIIFTTGIFDTLTKLDYTGWLTLKE